jgi:trehalose 6-phosphate synthase
MSAYMPSRRSPRSWIESRSAVAEYRELREQIEQVVGRINGKFTEPGRDVPVHYIHRGMPRERLVAYYLLADVMLVTPLKDGMNLVAKEYVVCQHATGRSGVLVLSEFTGAALELIGAVACNPFDVEGLSHAIEDALELDEGQRKDRIRSMGRKVRRNDVHRWMERELADLAQL